MSDFKAKMHQIGRGREGRGEVGKGGEEKGREGRGGEIRPAPQNIFGLTLLCCDTVAIASSISNTLLMR